MRKKNQYKVVILAFFDTAGEDMSNEKQMKQITKYIYNAAGIILLVDPLQFRKVREELVEEKQLTEADLPQANNECAGDIITYVNNLITHNRHDIPSEKMIPIPLAVAFSKIDMLKESLGADSRIFQESRHRGKLDLREFGEINDTIEEWIERYDDTKKFIPVTKNFENVGFFGVSALGGNPHNGRLQFTPRPIRVEDPFLWLLWKNNLIEGEQDKKKKR